MLNRKVNIQFRGNIKSKSVMKTFFFFSLPRFFQFFAPENNVLFPELPYRNSRTKIIPYIFESKAF